MTQYKYINLNDFPVHLPDGMGGQVLFRPGESTTRGWFGRFLARGQLSKVPYGIPTNRVPAHVKSVVQTQSVNIGNVNELAQALAQILATQKIDVRHSTVEHIDARRSDDFDTTDSSKKLAEAMTTERVKKSGNFKALGDKNRGNKRADADQTVDLLSNLE